MPLESITISCCSLNSKCLCRTHKAEGKRALPPQPSSSSTRILFLPSCFSPVSVFAFVVFCLWFCVDRWGRRGGSDALPTCTHWGLSPWFSQAGLIISYNTFSSVTPFSWYRTQIMGSPVLAGRTVCVAWLWAKAWVWFSVWFAFFFSSQCSSFVPSATYKNTFSLLESLCSAMAGNCSKEPLLLSVEGGFHGAWITVTWWPGQAGFCIIFESKCWDCVLCLIFCIVVPVLLLISFIIIVMVFFISFLFVVLWICVTAPNLLGMRQENVNRTCN